MKLICAACGKKFNQKNPLINLCNKCAKKGAKLLQEIYDEHGKYCNYKYSCPRSRFVSVSHIIDK